MKKLVVFLCLLCSFAGYSQNAKNDAPQYTTTTYLFKIDEVSDQNKLDQCVESVKQLKNVTESKAKYKPESKVAELIIVVTEKNRSSEGEEEFSPLDVKKTILNFGFSPSGFTIQNEQTN